MSTQKLTALALLAAMPTVTGAQHQTWRVNNKPLLATSCPTCETSLSVAIANAAEGDTIHLEASDISYNTATLDKRLVIIGPGYKLGGGAGNNPDLQASSRTALIDQLTVTQAASGSTLEGLEFQNQVTIQAVDGLVVTRCFFNTARITFDGGVNSTTSNVTLADNYMTTNGNEIIRASDANPQSMNNFIIRNNYMQGLVSISPARVVTNMVIERNTLNYPTVHSIHDATIAYNIFRVGHYTDSNNDVHHNLYDQNEAFPANNELIGSSEWNGMGSSYVFPPLNSASDDGMWIINAGNPHTGRGMYSGVSPYRPSGIPNIPAIYQLSSTVNADSQGNVQVTLSTRTNP